ncbi:GNAT family N-acetyltransferase [Thetidibacter halocola]|uniref:GNAT family N-acetyltransferase n=1 Tax=Thetidibacter halocola TaxID=2827239 RepID=A0A8J7WDX0_9RHOB|nr:GNAT family N-acetyltransferase [Thetidibacter halocola]MBS0125812.1 GNAT family N-acetyltransferase [Thetidibacter halocola]
MKAPCERHRPGPAARAAARLGGKVPVLDTRRLQLRGPRIYDFDAYAAILCSDRAQYMGGPFTRAQAWSDFTNYTALWLLHGHGLWTIDAQVAPSAGFALLGYEYDDPEAELGIFLTEAVEGQGIAQEALEAVRDHAFGALNWDSVVSYVDPLNTRCIALMERVGARLDTAAMETLEATLVYRHERGAA